MLVELLQRHRDAARSPEQRRAVNAILSCRTLQRGGHLYRCSPCAKLEFAYHSCHHRACPRVKGFASRGFFTHWMLRKVMRELFFQKPPAAATFQKSLTSQCILFLNVSFVIDQFPRTAKGGRKGQSLLMFSDAAAQVGGKTDVKPVVSF